MSDLFLVLGWTKVIPLLGIQANVTTLNRLKDKIQNFHGTTKLHFKIISKLNSIIGMSVLSLIYFAQNCRYQHSKCNFDSWKIQIF